MTSIATRQTRAPFRSSKTNIVWPAKYDLFGVRVAAADYDQIVDVVSRSAKERVPAIVSLHAVHAIVESIRPSPRRPRPG